MRATYYALCSLCLLIQPSHAADIDLQTENVRTNNALKAWDESQLPPPASAVSTPMDTPAEEEPEKEFNGIALQGLNKVTGHVSRLEGFLGATLRFGNLEISARKCWQAPADKRPENAALLEISELKQGEPPENIFLGWMFSSSPGLSGLEHPVYDITVLSCQNIEEDKATNDSH